MAVPNGQLESAPLLQDVEGLESEATTSGEMLRVPTNDPPRQSRLSSPVLSRRELAASGDQKDAAQEAWKRRRRSYIIVYSAIFCVAYVTSLDANTGFLYLNFACSEFGALASFSTIAIVQQLCFAIAKPPVAKVSDVFGRAKAYLVSLVIYVLGYIVVSTAPSLSRLMFGIVLQATGNTGLQVLQSIIIADSTTAKWRGLIIGIVNLPYLVNFAVAGPLVELVMRTQGWRFGFGMWTVILPLAALPLLITLFVGQKRAKRAGLLTTNPIRANSFGAAIVELARQVDAIGLALFSLAFSLILIPLSEAGHGAKAVASPKALFGTGLAFLFLFMLWESRASAPILPYRFFTNTAVVCICLVGVLDFCSFYISWTFLSAFIQILKGWDQTKTGYFASTQNVTSTLTGILVGWSMAATRKYKFLLVAGIIVRLLGVAMMVRYRSSGSPTFLLVLCQLLQGIGGGSAAITMQVAVQCVVRHSDVAIVTAIELLMTECGAAIGSAIAGMVFSQELPTALAIRLPDFSPEEIKVVFGSLSAATSYPLGSETRQAIIEAWVAVMHRLCIMAALILVPAVFLALAIPDGTLPDVHHHHHASTGSTHHHHHHPSGSRRSHHYSTSRRSRSTTRPLSGPSGSSVGGSLPLGGNHRKSGAKLHDSDRHQRALTIHTTEGRHVSSLFLVPSPGRDAPGDGGSGGSGVRHVSDPIPSASSSERGREIEDL